MKIGIVGLGSIGRKHASIVHELGGSVYALRSNKGSLKRLTGDLKFVQQITELRKFKESGLDAVIISTPTSIHISNLTDIADLDVPVLVEKPIASELSDLSVLSKQQQGRIRVAFCLRFHPITLKVKEVISSFKLGRVLKANLVVGQHLPTWHPYTDYRTEYFSKKSLGGGALRTLSHELDLAYHWFGDYEATFAFADKLSDLEIDVDDNVFILNRHKEGVTTNITIDFLAPKVRRYGYVLFEHGELHYDMIASTLTINHYHGVPDEIIELEPNDMYKTQMIDFFKLIESEESKLATYRDSVHIMKLISAVEKSTIEKKLIKI